MQNSLSSEFLIFKKRTDSDKVKFNKRLLIYLFFLLISAIFWVLTALNKNYSVQLEFPVRYHNFPSDKVLVSDVPHRLNLRINGHGFTIIKHKFYSGLSPLKIDVMASGIAPIDTASQLYFVLTRRFREGLSNQIGEELQVVSVSPDTLYFILDEIISKSIPVRPDVNLSFKKQYMKKSIVNVSPDSIMVFGPQIIIDTLQWVSTMPIEKSRVNDTIREDVRLKPIKTLQYGVDKVSVSIPVEKYTEVSLTIPIEAINLPNKLILKTFPGYITISAMVAVSDYSKISPDIFRAIVNYDDLQGENNKLKVSLMKVPDFVVNVKYSPKNVDFLIEK